MNNSRTIAAMLAGASVGLAAGLWITLLLLELGQIGPWVHASQPGDNHAPGELAGASGAVWGRVGALEAHAAALAADLEAAHGQIRALRWQLGVVAGTCPGRERPPRPLWPAPSRPTIPPLAAEAAP